MDSAADARWYEIQVLPPSVDLQITDAKRAKIAPSGDLTSWMLCGLASGSCGNLAFSTGIFASCPARA